MSRRVPQKPEKNQEKPRARRKVSVDETCLLDERSPDPKRLLAWYDRHARVLPWRYDRRDKNRWPPNPYHVWLSEIMLQQTTVATVQPYFLKFIQKWPRLEDLAAATEEDVRRMWAGLGYYRRARYLHACARQLVENYGGVFPQTEAELLKLDGIGAYTAAAITAIAFDRKANVVDGNVERVMARLYALETPWPEVKKEVKAIAAKLVPEKRSGDYAQALMDLGATVCTPRSPSCDLCPWCAVCMAAETKNPEAYPVRGVKKQKPQRRAIAFVFLSDDRQSIWLRQRPRTGLLADMMEVPSTPWTTDPLLDWSDALPQSPAPEAVWQKVKGTVTHIFTHFDLELTVYVAANCKKCEKGMRQRKEKGLWVPLQETEQEALPSVMHKIISHTLAHNPPDRKKG